MNPVRPLLLGLALAAISGAAFAETPKATTLQPTDDAAVMSTEGFLAYHPDLRYRLAGLRDYREQRYAEALADFKRAARYADKPSQGMIAEMLWNGQGMAVDRAAAYAWMDLAAERGYKMMLVKRENIWAELDAAERARALEIGEDLYAEYSDAQAKPRMEAKMRKARMKMTGSRTGFVGSVRIEIPTPNGSRTIDGTTYYADQFWKPGAYWRMQDSDWKEFGEGSVEIGALQSAGELPEDSLLPDEDEPR